ncbi:solute carrier family 23 protein, partial [Escherichia coli]|uniref:solute carrier family 23 protein n=1 Tax=Escherichia coli TaxID=562 RepID=UPI00289CC1B3
MEDREEAKKSYQVVSVMSVLSGVFGTSPAITLSENGAGIQEGGRTGLSTSVAGLLFLVALFVTPLFSYIPAVAAGPV